MQMTTFAVLKCYEDCQRQHLDLVKKPGKLQIPMSAVLEKLAEQGM